MLGIFDSGIEIFTSKDGESYSFFSFQDRNLAYTRTKSLWRNISPHAQNKSITEDEDDDTGEDPNKVKSTHSSPKHDVDIASNDRRA